MKNTNVCFVVDNFYGPPMIASILSIIKNVKKENKVKFHIIDLGLSVNKKKIIRKIMEDNKFEFEIIKSPLDKVKNFSIKTHVSSAAYIKVFLPEILNELNEIIYLDCDLIVDTDISNLMSDFNESFEVQAVWNPFYNYDNKYLGIKDNSKTFNTGVMILNLKLMRKNKSSDKLFKFLIDNHDKTKLHDQAAFNYLYKNRWGKLDLKWNYQVSLIQNHYKKLGITKKEYKKIFDNPNIIHYTSNSKPWHFRNAHPYKSKYQLYELKIFKKKDFSTIALLKRIKEELRYFYFKMINKF